VLSQILRQRPEILKEIIKDQPEIAAAIGQQSIPSAIWDLACLKRCLSCILRQQAVPTDICFFFDALDEYDGPPEAASMFLEDLVSKPGHDNDKVKVKILFSSRPWPVFEAHFGGHPGLRLHDHTQQDIRNYCHERIATRPHTLRSVIDVVPDIVDKARGSFLWVKLLMQTMLKKWSASDRPSLESVREVLDEFPDELEDYYTHIVKRLGTHHRMETYALLELVVRSSDDDFDWTLGALVSAVRCSQSRTWQQADASIKDGDFSEGNVAELKSLIKTWSGGLVEVQYHWTRSSGMRYSAQLMHQTVYEFVVSSAFKDLVLQDLSAVINENGHTYVLKWALVMVPRKLQPHHLETSGESDTGRVQYPPTGVNQIIFHGNKSEKTTGVSSGYFLDTMAENTLQGIQSHFQSLRMDYELILRERMATEIFDPPWESPLPLAAAASLDLYLRNVVANDPKVFQDTNYPLMLYAFEFNIYNSVCEPLATANLLFQHGCSIVSNADSLLAHLCSVKQLNYPGSLLPSRLQDRILNHNAAVKDFMLKHGTNPNWGNLLHVCRHPQAVASLLSWHVDPNAKNAQSETPLDIIFQELSGICPLRDRIHSMNWVAAAAGAIFEAGGRCNQAMSSTEWQAILARLDELEPEATALRCWITAESQKLPKPLSATVTPPNRTSQLDTSNPPESSEYATRRRLRRKVKRVFCLG